MAASKFADPIHADLMHFSNGRLTAAGLVLIALPLFWVTGNSVLPSDAASTHQAVLLHPGVELERHLSPGQVHRYSIDVPADYCLSLQVAQEGVDIEVALYPSAATSDIPIVLDSFNRTWGTEDVWWVALHSQRLELQLRSLGGEDNRGRYRIRNLTLHPATKEDRQRALVQETLAARRDLTTLAWAEERWKQLGEQYQQSLLLIELAFRSYEEDDLAVQYLDSAAELLPALAAEDAVYVGNLIGDLYRRRGEITEASRRLERALELARGIGLLREEASALNNLGLIAVMKGHDRLAVRLFGRAVELFEQIDDPMEVAAVRHNRGVSLSRLGSLLAAEEDLRAALKTRSESIVNEEHERVLAETRALLGWVGLLRCRKQLDVICKEAQYWLGKSLEFYERSHHYRSSESHIGVLDRLGTTYREAGEFDRSKEFYLRALELAEATYSTAAKAHTFANLAALEIDRGQPAMGRNHAEEALRLFGTLSPGGHAELHAWFLKGMAELDLGRSRSALQIAEHVVERVEQLRKEGSDIVLSHGFLSGRRSYYELKTSVLMTLHEQQDSAEHTRHLARAFETSEAARMQSLLDQLMMSSVESVPPGIRTSSLEAIQHDLLDNETLLIELFLGDRVSFLWIVGRGKLVSFELPPRHTLEMLAKEARQELQTSSATGKALDFSSTSELSRILLQPVTEHLIGAKRLVVVAGGEFHKLAFTALPWKGDLRLLDAFELIRAPSASALLAARHRERWDPLRDPAALVVSHPVFSNWDDRVRQPQPAFRNWLGQLLRDAVREDGIWLSLPRTKDEAQAITQHFTGEITSLASAGANLENLLNLDLSRYTLLHFATHGYVPQSTPDPVLLTQRFMQPLAGSREIIGLTSPGYFPLDDPSQVALVLSTVDEEGRDIDHLLTAELIAGLDLRAELVVLSACRTGDGPYLQSEGLYSLARAFQIAGARRVLVSLWDVEDAATARLMEAFYKAYLEEGKPAETALREAQLELRSIPGYEAPFYWAGFELQGDWR